MAFESAYQIITQRNRTDTFVGLIEDVTYYQPEFSVINGVVRSGVDYYTLTRTGLPQAQFRNLNQGITGSVSQWKKNLHQMFFVDTQIIVDQAVYAGDDGSTGDLLQQEGAGALQSTINLFGSQFYYGTNQTTPSSYNVNNTTTINSGGQGFVGIRQQLLSNQQTNPTATPVTASNSSTSSTVYGVWNDPQGVSFQLGRFGEVAILPFKQQLYNPPGQNGSIIAWYSNISTYIGLQVGSAESVFGVTGVTAAAPFTDNLGIQLIATVPLTRRNNFTWFMNRASHAGLQMSRSSIKNQPAIGPNGDPAVGPPPEKCNGFNIIVTDSITNTENNS